MLVITFRPSAETYAHSSVLCSSAVTGFILRLLYVPYVVNNSSKDATEYPIKNTESFLDNASRKTSNAFVISSQLKLIVHGVTKCRTCWKNAVQ